MKASELRTRDKKELRKELVLTQKELCSLRLQKNAVDDTTAKSRVCSLLPVRRKIARIKTVLHEKNHD